VAISITNDKYISVLVNQGFALCLTPLLYAIIAVTMTNNILSPDAQYMRLALRLARRGLGKTSPNPMVGAVIVKEDRIIGQGYHRRFGGDHAEVDALKHTKEDASGATLYVTLEPCRHWGKTPPCTDAIIERKIDKVVIGMLDPFPEMRGKSVELLKQKGIETVVGVLETECRSLNEAYLKYTTTGLPFVTVKFAQTLDGRIATAPGASRWISSPASLKLAHKLRATHDAILVGVNTVLTDNPELTTRLVKGRNPVRVILDSKIRIPLDAKVLTNQKAARTLVAATPAADKAKLSALKSMGIEVLTVSPDKQGRVDLKQLLKTLGQRQISSLLVEGGGAVITSFLRLNLVDRLVAIIAPKILGKGTDSVGELNITDLSQALKLSSVKTCRSGVDMVVEGRVGS
jgi:diaminohydroxyphosphoribosylaminopyrimidine deaminase/5-amino-6-(5-phosphoribosylamino)uracil reductase